MWHCDKSRTIAVRNGLTFLEVLLLVATVAIVLGLFLPSVRTGREAARRMQCSNNLKQLALALHSYADTFKHFPAAIVGTGMAPSDLNANENRLSGMVALLAFLEQQKLWQQISNASEFGGINYPAMGPAPWVASYPPWQQEIPVFRCPSSAANPSLFGKTNYAFCIGDITQKLYNPSRLRGVFGGRLVCKLADITDGISNTIAIAEIGTRANRSLAGQYAIQQPAAMLLNPSDCARQRNRENGTDYPPSIYLSELGRGGRWADGSAGYTLFGSVLPPNSPSCAVGDSEGVDGVYSAGSLHSGGAQVVFADGIVRFISEDIDTGVIRRSPVTDEEYSRGPVSSPYGVWGSLGTINGSEKIAPEW